MWVSGSQNAFHEADSTVFQVKCQKNIKKLEITENVKKNLFLHHISGALAG